MSDFISGKRRSLENRIKSNQEELQKILTKNDGDGSIHSLNKTKLTKELDLKYHKDSIFSCMYHAILHIYIFWSIKAFLI